MASNTIAEISRQDLQRLIIPSPVSITDVKQLSSYNWIERPTPTIVVPGSPPLWSPPSVPRRLKKDSGRIYIAQNAARHPDSPLEPLFRALYTTNPSFDIRSIDVVTDRNNIRKLLSFIDSGSSGNQLEQATNITINIEVINNTAIFSRNETAADVFIGPGQFRGFGHEFEKAYTASQISGSTGHHRIISYRFGGLNFIVRYETDGYVDADIKRPSPKREEPEYDSLSGMLGSLSLHSANSTPNTTPASSKLTVQEGGHVIPLDSTLEIKTRVFHKRLQIPEVAPQLWISQTPKLVRAYHDRGLFRKSEVEDVAAEVKRWEEVNQWQLRKLAAVINRIRDIVKECGGNVSVKYDVGGDKLVFRKVAAGNQMLPEDLYSKWDGIDKSVVENHMGGDSRAETVTESVEGIKIREDGESIEGKLENQDDTPF